MLQHSLMRALNVCLSKPSYHLKIGVQDLLTLMEYCSHIQERGLIEDEAVISLSDAEFSEFWSSDIESEVEFEADILF
jgi:hypothetical protein